MSQNNIKEIRVEEFARYQLGFKSCDVLEVFQGYLIAGEMDKLSRCFWINKQNIEGLVEVAKIVAIESAFSAILSFIPGGSFAYKLIRDQVGYPPRANIIFEPDFYEVYYQTFAFTPDGKAKGITGGVVQGIDQLTKIAFKTSEKVHSVFKDLLADHDTSDAVSEPFQGAEAVGFTMIRFYDKVSIIRRNLVQSRLEKTNSQVKKIATSATAGIIPSVVATFKTTANNEAEEFLHHLRKVGFNVRMAKNED